MDEFVITPAGLLDILSKIDELKSVDVSITETEDNTLQLQVGDSIYQIDHDCIELIPTTVETVEDIADLNNDTYDTLSSTGEILVGEPIKSGIIGELAKTLFIGGVARLTAKYLKK